MCVSVLARIERISTNDMETVAWREKVVSREEAEERMSEGPLSGSTSIDPVEKEVTKIREWKKRHRLLVNDWRNRA